MPTAYLRLRLRLAFFPLLRLAALPAFEIFAARVFDMPLRLSALYFFLFLIELPAVRPGSTR